MENKDQIHQTEYSKCETDTQALDVVSGGADEHEILKFIDYVSGLSHVLSVLYLPSKGGDCIGRTFDVEDASSIVSYVLKHNAAKRNIYWLPNFSLVKDKKPKDIDMAAALFTWADCDPDITRFGSYKAARAHLVGAQADKLKPLASLLIDSGNGLQALFRLADPLALDDGLTEYKKVNAAVGRAFEGPGTYDASRIMRFPGTMNWPTPAKLAKGYPDTPGFSRVISINDRAYTLEELSALAVEHGGVQDDDLAQAGSVGSVTRHVPAGVDMETGEIDWQAKFEALLAIDVKLRDRYEGGTAGLTDASGSGMDMSIYAMLVSRRFPHDAICGILQDWPHGSEGGRAQGDRYWDRLGGNTKAEPKEYTPAEKAVEDLNRSHAYVLLGGSGAVLKETGAEFDFIKLDAFRAFYANQKVEVETKDSKGNPVNKWMPVADVWMQSPARRTFSGVEFAPGGARAGNFNMWRGFAVSPLDDMGVFSAGLRCRRLLAHIKYNVCQGDRIRFRYFVNWCADMIQHPGVKPGVAVSINGAKGTGKTKVIEALSALLGTHAQSVSQSGQLLGQFNGHHANSLLIAAEESFWAGDKKAEGALKHMVTSETLMLEKKGIDAVSVKSLSRYIFIGNAEWLFPATADERRLFALTCGDDRRQDYGYFKAIDEQLYGVGKRWTQVGDTAHGLRAFLAFLQSVDLKGFEIRRIPETDALAQQRTATLEPHDRFMMECLANHDLNNAAWTTQGRRVVKTELYEAYARAAKAMGCSHPVSQDTFAKRVKKIFGWGAVRNGSAPREWKVTGWAESKAAFEKFTRVRVADDGDEEADDDEDFAVSDLISAKSADLQNFTVSDDCSDLV